MACYLAILAPRARGWHRDEKSLQLDHGLAKFGRWVWHRRRITQWGRASASWVYKHCQMKAYLTEPRMPARQCLRGRPVSYLKRCRLGLQRGQYRLVMARLAASTNQGDCGPTSGESRNGPASSAGSKWRRWNSSRMMSRVGIEGCYKGTFQWGKVLPCRSCLGRQHIALPVGEVVTGGSHF